MRISYFYLIFIIFIILRNTNTKCSYRVLKNGKPEKVDQQPHLVSGLTQCLEYNGKLGCCDQNTDSSQITPYKEIDGVFGSAGDGCDICAINLKRFWCQYACSPRQSDFLKVDEGFVPVPDPLRPGKMIQVQKVKLTIEAQTACDIFNSCKRVSFVTSVSAIGTPAGFLTFQGHNAMDDGFQYIDTSFVYQKNNSLYFSDEREEQSGKRLQMCNYTTSSSTDHQFPFFKNCTCNNCQESCDNSSGFHYHDPQVLESFNFILVSTVWGAVIIITIILGVRRNSIKGKLK